MEYLNSSFNKPFDCVKSMAMVETESASFLDVIQKRIFYICGGHFDHARISVAFLILFFRVDQLIYDKQKRYRSQTEI